MERGLAVTLIMLGIGLLVTLIMFACNPSEQSEQEDFKPAYAVETKHNTLSKMEYLVHAGDMPLGVFKLTVDTTVYIVVNKSWQGGIAIIKHN